MSSSTLVVLLLATVVSVTLAAVTIQRVDAPEAVYKGQGNEECTSIYTITLEPQWTTQANDIAHSPPHGKNTLGYGSIEPNRWVDWTVPITQIGADYTNQPFANNPDKQAQAKAKFSVTALTEPSATPLGFISATSRMYHSVCVRVRNVGRRWVELMVQTTNPNQQMCVPDWRPDNITESRPNLQENPFQESCGKGDLYVCRSSPNQLISTGVWEDKMNVKFYCRDSCDDPMFNFYFRITASQEIPKTTVNGQWVQPDGEDWCMYRKSDDYPSTLLNPYPANYIPPVVFASSTSSASTISVSVSVIVLSVLALLLL